MHLFWSRLLGRVYSITCNETYKTEAAKSVKFVSNINKQMVLGHTVSKVYYWVDNFHTGFNLECIANYKHYTNDTSVEEALERGFNYYVNTFDGKGRSNYYNNKLFH
jgi:hypothetical protein